MLYTTLLANSSLVYSLIEIVLLSFPFLWYFPDKINYDTTYYCEFMIALNVRLGQPIFTDFSVLVAPVNV